MSLNWPIPSSIGELYTFSGSSWEWDGQAWNYVGNIGATGAAGTNSSQTGPTGATGPTGINILSSGVVARNGSQQIGTGLTLLNFPVEDFDIASEWNGTRFTAASTGYYFYSAQITSKDATVTQRLFARLNGVTLIADHTITNQELSNRTTGIVGLGIGEYIEFLATRGSVGNTENNNNLNYISIYKL